MSSEENSDDRPITVGVIDDDPMICQAMRLILEDYSTGRLNVVFTCTDGGQAVDEAGAEGFVSKTDAPEDIIRRITDVCDGLPQFNPSSQRQLINDLNMQQPQSRRDEARAMLDALPEREREAVVLAADGYTNAEIAERMFISERTVKAHISSAGDRLCMGRVQMARLVERADLPDQL